MKKFTLLFALILVSIYGLKAQWTNGTNINNTNSGNVGIGTISPKFKFHIKANANSESMTLNSNTTGSFALTSADGGEYGLFAGVGYSGKAWLQVGRYDGGNLAYDLSLQAAGGNLGIGTTNPKFKFHILGGNANSELMTLGTSTTGNFALTSTNGLEYGLFGGIGDSGNAWLQVGSYKNNIAYNLILQAAGGKVGIGTITPLVPLQVNANSYTDNMTLGTATGGFSLTGTNGRFGLFCGVADNGHVWMQVGRNDGETETYPLTFQTKGGNVGIGITNPQYKLAVDGTIAAREVKVTAEAWADFVFHPTYKLRPLGEVEQFIKTNNHLPEIPTETEVKQNGVSLGEMNAKLLQKIEELTLYMIEQNKKMDQQQSRIQELEQQNQSILELKKEISEIKNSLKIKITK